MSDFHFSTDTADSPPQRPDDTIVGELHFEIVEDAGRMVKIDLAPYLSPCCYRCGAEVDLQHLAVGEHAGKHVCVRCLDKALRRVDNEQ